ncbi:MAG TPA: SpoIIE family protein phosphatase [Azospirillaceae bacterium]|nr:SpoIIE family protein phosphatase [Azospirillaceae bacterium]
MQSDILSHGIDDEAIDLGPVLIVDDDPLSRRLLEVALASLDYEVMVAENGAEALELLKRHPIGLVLTDWVMPEMGGAELCRRIRETVTDRYVVIVVLTARTNREALIEALETGANDFLSKPPDLEELQARLSAGRRIQRLERQLEARNRRVAAVHAELAQAYERIESDLKMADRTLRRQLPAPGDLGGVRFAWLFEPSAHLGGDIFDVAVSPGGDLAAFYHIDVAGHGVPAALTSSTLQSLLSGAVKRGGARRGESAPWYSRPILVADELNRRYCRPGEVDGYFTMLYGVVDRRTGRGELTNAGHPPPLIWRASEGRWERLGDGGMPVGLLEDAAFEVLSFELKPGDRLVLHSDGIDECASAGGEAFGDERLGEALAGAAGDSLDDFVASIAVLLRQWRAAPSFEDDVSLLVIEKTGRD